jgi:hypothetical protein
MARIGDAEKGPYYSHEIAARVALTEAVALRREGRRARLSYLDSDGNVRVERCMCGRFPARLSA